MCPLRYIPREDDDVMSDTMKRKETQEGIK